MVLVSLQKDVLHKKYKAESGFIFTELCLGLKEYECAHPILCKTNKTAKNNVGFLHLCLSKISKNTKHCTTL